MMVDAADIATPREAALISQYSSHHYDLPHWTVEDLPALSGRYLGRARRMPSFVRKIDEQVAPYDAQPASPQFNVPSHEDFMAARGYIERNPRLFGPRGYSKLMSTADQRYGVKRTFSEAFEELETIWFGGRRVRIVPRENPSDLSFDPPSERDYLSSIHFRRPPSPGGGGGGATIPPIEIR
jgi:hypothetical protein